MSSRARIRVHSAVTRSAFSPLRGAQQMLNTYQFSPSSLERQLEEAAMDQDRNRGPLESHVSPDTNIQHSPDHRNDQTPSPPSGREG